MSRSATSLHATAVQFANRGRLADAERALQRARAATDNRDLRARIEGTQAVIHLRHGEGELADTLCRTLLEDLSLSAETRAVLTGQRGTIAAETGRFDEALRWWREALATVQDPVERANLLINRSVLNTERRRLDEAAADCEAAAAAFDSAGLSIDAAEARHNLGYIDLLRGDLVGGLREMTRARPVLAAASVISSAVSDLDRAAVMRDAGLVGEAERLLSRAAAAFGSRRVVKPRAEAEYSLALSLLAHDPVAARRTAAAAARHFRAIGQGPWAARADALRLRAGFSGGYVDAEGNRVPEPARPASAADVGHVIEALERYGLRADAVTVRLAYEIWLARRGRRPAAPVPRLPASAPIQLSLLSHELRATRAANARRGAELRRHAARGLDELARWQQDFGSLDLQTSTTVLAAPLLELGIDSALATGRPEEVFEWSERARHINLQVRPLRPPRDEALAGDLATLRMIRAEGDDWASDPRVAELRDSARARQWAQTGSLSTVRRATLDELEAALGADAALVAYVFSGEAIHALTVTAEGRALRFISSWPELRRMLSGLRADLEMAATMRTGPFADAVARSLDDRLRALSALLVEPVVRALDARRLVVTVPGVLNGIPWAMLPGMRGRVFTLAASASRWVSLRDGASAPPGPVGFVTGPRVARADEEVLAAAAHWAEARVLHQPTVDDATSLADDVDVLHVAAHGRHSAENPLFSGLELADGTLFGYDIDLIARVPRTVVLSACEVGRSSVRWGEEAVGMTRVWLHAGTRCVIAAPVVVADDLACELLGAMHESLAAGRPPAVALAEAFDGTGIAAPFQAHGSGF